MESHKQRSLAKEKSVDTRQQILALCTAHVVTPEQEARRNILLEPCGAVLHHVYHAHFTYRDDQSH